MDDTLVRYAHFVGIMLLAAMLVAQNLLLSHRLPRRELRRLLLLDRVYGLAAMIILAAGLLLWLMVGKASAFYSANPLFHAKLGLFALVAAMSLFPTVALLKLQRQAGDVLAVSPSIVLIKRLELVLLMIFPLLAVLIAKGVGNG